MIPRLLVHAVGVGIFAVGNQIIEVPLPPEVLHVAIDIGCRISLERRLIIDALLDELPLGVVVAEAPLIERAIGIGIARLDDAPIQAVVLEFTARARAVGDLDKSIPGIARVGVRDVVCAGPSQSIKWTRFDRCSR